MSKPCDSDLMTVTSPSAASETKIIIKNLSKAVKNDARVYIY